jgi:hypothetical protein
MTYLRGISAGIAAAAMLGLAACGGGGGGGDDDNSSPPANPGSPQGFYEGSSGTTASRRDMLLHVLDNGRVYGLYTGPAGSDGGYIAGVVVGDGTTTGNTFAATNARDYNFESFRVTPASLSSTFDSGNEIEGTITPNGASAIRFSGEYDDAYEDKADLVTIRGGYHGTWASSEGDIAPKSQNNVQGYVSFTILPDGDVDFMTSDGCLADMDVTPRSKGNAYDVTFTAGALCPWPQYTQFKGHFFYAEDDVGYMFLTDDARTKTVMIIGEKQQ